MLRVSHIENAIFSSRTYILSPENGSDAWLVDCGDLTPVTDYLGSMVGDTYCIRGVLLTHVHYDHFYGLPELTKQFPSIQVYTNESGKQALANNRVNMSRYHDDPINYDSGNVIVCGEGSVIDLFDGVSAHVYYTPGHSPSCLTFEIANYLFTGDAFIPGFSVVTRFRDSDKKLAAQSLDRIKLLAGDRIVCPGHEIKDVVY